MTERRDVDRCYGKVRFETPQMAFLVRDRRAERGRPSDVLHCLECGGYHLGTNPGQRPKIAAWKRRFRSR